MKRLLKFILSGSLMLSFASCSKYYIHTLSSNNLMKDKATGEFLLENDSVKITYGFGGQDAPLHIKVFNKLQVPIYVDWSRSSMIYEGKATSFVPDQINFSGNVSSSTWDNWTPTNTESTMSGTVQNPKNVTFIPPNAGFETVLRSFKPDIFNSLSDAIYTESDYLSTAYGSTKVRAGSFDQNSSPLSFRTYLTLYTQEGRDNKVFSFDRNFYVSKSLKTSARPQNYFEYTTLPGNVFYHSKATAYGKTMTGVAVVGLVAGAAAVQPAESQK